MVLPWTWFRLHLDQLARDKRTQGHGHRDSRTGKTGNRSSGRRRLRFREIVVANAALTALCRCFCTLHITEIPRTHCLTQNVTGQLLADDWGGVTESVRCRRWRE